MRGRSRTVQTTLSVPLDAPCAPAPLSLADRDVVLESIKETSQSGAVGHCMSLEAVKIEKLFMALVY